MGGYVMRVVCMGARVGVGVFLVAVFFAAVAADSMREQAIAHPDVRALLISSYLGSVAPYGASNQGKSRTLPEPIACEGDACQPLPSPPEDQVVGTLVPGLGNPPVHFHKYGSHKKGHKHHRPKRRSADGNRKPESR
jgi:hypothetical protein